MSRTITGRASARRGSIPGTHWADPDVPMCPADAPWLPQASRRWPELMLWIALINLTVGDLSSGSPLVRRDALRWVLSRSEARNSFGWICATAGLEVETCRAAVLARAGGQRRNREVRA